MEFKNQKPFTPTQRHLIQLNTVHLQKKPLIKKKINGLKNSSGRNNIGRITVRHKGGGHKKKYRQIEFNRNYESVGITCGIEYDPNRNANIASIYGISNSDFYYIIAPKSLKTGDIIKSGQNVETKLGNSLPLSEIPIGSLVHNVSAKPFKKAQISRSAGTFSRLKEKNSNTARIELSSGKYTILSPECYATIGIVSNDLISLTQRGKAGRSRWLNKRPAVRGVAMNPIDHTWGWRREKIW